MSQAVTLASTVCQQDHFISGRVALNVTEPGLSVRALVFANNIIHFGAVCPDWRAPHGKPVSEKLPLYDNKTACAAANPAPASKR